MRNWRKHVGVIKAAAEIRAGGVIAYPTEAVWGLGCDPLDVDAVEKILSLKRRPVEKGLIMVAGSVAQFGPLVEALPADLKAKLEASWPGHTTWLVPHGGLVPAWISGQFDTVALRVSNHPLVQALCDLVGGPIVSTSANPQGRPPARSALHARRYFTDQVLYAPGQVGGQDQPSKIYDLVSGKTIRA